MAIPCASQPLNVTFSGGIKINYPMPFNQETLNYLTGIIEDFPTDMLGLTINTEDLKLTLNEKVETLIPPITIPMDCNPDGYIEVSTVTVNPVAVSGVVNFVVSANLFKDNSVTIPNLVSLAWPSANGAEYIDEHILVYADSIDDEYQLDVSVTRLALKSVDAVIDSNLYTFKVSGELEIKAVKI